MKFFVISILLWKDEKNDHRIKDFLNTCQEEQKYIFFRNKNTKENYTPYESDIENINSIKKDDIVFLRVRLNSYGVYKYYSFGKFINLENINSYVVFNKYIQHKEENFQLINISNTEINFEGVKGKEENKRIFEMSENDALYIARKITKNDNFKFQDNSMEELKESCIGLLKSNYNLILTGAPGTGKTSLAISLAKEMMKDNMHIKDHKQFIIDYYNKNKERLDNLKKEGDKLREQFINKFPIESLKNINIDDYAVGRGDNNSFCYWIEFGLKRELLDNFSIGGAKSYLLYYDKKTGNLVNETDKTDDELIKEIGEELYKMANTENYDYKDSVFNKRKNYLAIKIYNTYHPYTYFPMMSKKYMLSICDIFGIGKDNNIYKLNKNIKRFFDDNCTDIDSYIIKMILLENVNLLKGEVENVNSEEADYGFVQFYPSYDYTDFVEGLRPIKDSDGKIGFERKDGVFKEFCKNALKNRGSKFVFIIDEINRGEISKIFGELFFAIDPGYRSERGKVKTQYNNLINNDENDEDDEFEDGFFVPENVYIIGTMNDIDRSVESMDFAMRRRFAWKEVKAEDTQYMLDTMFDDNKEITEEYKQLFIEKAKKRMNALNNAISKIEGFNSSYHIGASYFLKLKNYYNGSNENEAFNSLWENHLRGLLYEYLRGMPDAIVNLDNLEEIYNGLIDEEDDA